MTTATTSRVKTKQYDYEVVDAAGKHTKGRLEAPSEDAVANALRQQGVTPLSIREAGTGLNREIAIPGLGDRVKLKDLAIFARQFATMSSSGLSLLRSLAILEEQTSKPKLAKAIHDIRLDVEGGASLSGAMGKHTKLFPRLMVAMIAAGEAGGFLDDALDRIAANLEKDANLRQKVKSAMTYPVIVLSFSVVMVAAVLIFIVPVFTKMFNQLGAQLPLPTRILVAASDQAWWMLPLFIVAAVTAVLWIRRQQRDNPEFRLRFDQLKLRLPVFGSLFSKIALSRWSRNLGTLLSVGVPIMQALDIVGDTSGNEVISRAMGSVKDAVRDGLPVSSALGDSPLFPAMVVQMIEVGEESGRLSPMLDKVADFYDQEVDAATEQLAAAIEPVMVVLMGAIVGTVVVSLYLPMFTVYEHIQGATS
jgi:type IV pilus assembly protein PilC